MDDLLVQVYKGILWNVGVRWVLLWDDKETMFIEGMEWDEFSASNLYRKMKAWGFPNRKAICDALAQMRVNLESSSVSVEGEEK